MKGISPIVATAILIGLTIVLAGILGVWATYFVTQRTQNATAPCDLIVPELIDISCYYNNGNITILLDNKNKYGLKGFNVIIEYLTRPPIVRYSDVNLTAAGIAQIELQNIEAGYQKIKVRSVECPIIEKQC